TRADAPTLGPLSPKLREVAERPCRAGGEGREACCRKSRMVEISLSGSGEGPGWASSRGYSTTHFRPDSRQISYWAQGWRLKVACGLGPVNLAPNLASGKVKSGFLCRYRGMTT